MIPNKLRDQSLNFCLVEKPAQGVSTSGKKPFQENWPKLNIKWDNKQLGIWLSQSGNYGVIGGGEKNLVIIDFDDKVVQEEVIKKLPETFTVKTGGGLLHKYYFTDGGKSFKILDIEGKTLADIQSDGKQVVGPGSKHYSGNMYELKDNFPIATMKFEDIRNLLIPFNKFKKGKMEQQEPKKFTGIDDFQDDLFSSITLESLLSDFGVNVSQNPSNCPFHDSKGGKCLGWDKDTAHCFHCDGAWNKISWIKENQDCNAKEAIEWLAEKEGRTAELEKSREEWKEQKIKDDIISITKTIKGRDDDRFEERKINWTDEKICWDDMREDVRKIMTATEKFFMVCSKQDEIIGKPQLIHTTKKAITLVRLTEKEKGRKGQEEIVRKIKFLDEASDKRSGGVVIDSWSKNFWTYKVISDNKEYYLLSENELPIQSCNIKGMLMEVNDMAEMNQSLKIKSLSNLFFVHSFVPAVKIISKEAIVNFTKERKITEEVWINHLNKHPLGTINNFPTNSNLIRSIHVLSGKKDGWPLHLGVMGPAGTRKSMGYVETIAHKFDEFPQIVEGANSRIKGLSPSFKEKPANIGYLAKCERMGWIDELGKMIEFEQQKHDNTTGNVLGELNFLLEHKRRTVGSGNDNDCVVQANAKFLFVTNPIEKKYTIGEHIGSMDATTMSRILWWIQDEEEQTFVISSAGITREKSPHHLQTKSVCVDTTTKNKKPYFSRVSVGGISSEQNLASDEFLTLFDTINSFICDVDDEKVDELSKKVLEKSYGSMADIWKSRGPHHVTLLIDGITKHRCLFKDYDHSFKIKQEDYDLVEKLLIDMVKRWGTYMKIK